MDYLEKLKAYNAMETIKDIPPWLQPLSLLMLGDCFGKAWCSCSGASSLHY